MSNLPDWKILDRPAWLALKAAGEVIEQDTRGVKVLRCDNGDFIKLFRIKRQFTLARLFNPAHVFWRNAETLQHLQIRTLTPVALYHLSHAGRWAVRYQPLAGDTVRSLLQQEKFSTQHIEQLGQFIALLHARGIYFRSLHPGNVVVCPDGAMGLIDILDCHFRWRQRPLNIFQRQRNFRHFFRYTDGKKIEAALRAAYDAARRHAPR